MSSNDAGTRTSTDKRRSTAGPRRRLALAVAWSPDIEARYRRIVSDTEVQVGRSVEPGCCLQDSKLSRRHAVVRFGEPLVVEDLASRNGTFLNGHEIHGPSELAESDVVRMGDTLFVVEPERAADAPRIPKVVGGSGAMARVCESIAKYGPTSLTALLVGPTGSGKEVVAAALHERSGRRGEKVDLSCAEIPEALAEAELFGHARGAFTGAVQSRVGAFRRADGGTLFLDEIGELPPALQAKLLRVLETGHVRGLGEERGSRVDVRIIAATHRDLAADVRDGRFREDLYRRLKVVSLTLPPLTQHRRDIPALVEHFARAGERSELTLDADVWEALLVYDWPGNVRDLRSEVARLCVEVPPGTVGELDHLSPEVRCGPRDVEGATAGERPELSPERIEEAIRAAGGNRSLAARRLGIGRATLYRWLEKPSASAGE